MFLGTDPVYSTFSQTHKVGKNDQFCITIYLNFLLYLYLKMLVNVKLDDSW